MENGLTTVQILSFNLRMAPAERKTPDAWALRRGFCLDIIRQGGYDFVGTQEAWFAPEDPDIDQGGDLSRGLPEYGMLGDSRGADPAHGEGCPILYRRDRWELDPADHGTLWLSETPALRGSKSWDTDCPRILVWGRFHELDGGRRTGRTVLFSNTHIDYIYEHTALMQVVLCDRILAKIARPGEPLFLTGDFNMWERTWPILHLRGEKLPIDSSIPPAPLPLRDAWREVNPTLPDTRTFHKWGGSCRNMRIDYVFFAGEGVTARSCDLIRDMRDGRFPSDHYPLSATFSAEWPQ